MMKSAKNTILMLTVFILIFIISYGFDQQASLFFKSLKLPIFDFVFGVITNFGVVILIALVIPSIIFYKRNKKLAYLLWLIFITSFVLAFIIKLTFLRQRPIEAFTYPFTSIINYSFPSMHAMVVFSLLPLLLKHFSKQKYFWIIFAFLVAFSRIYLGVHFLSDVVFGAFLGYFIGSRLLEFKYKGKLWAK